MTTNQALPEPDMLETLSGDSGAVALERDRAVPVPGHWMHRSVNVGDEPFVTKYCYAADAGQGGMAQLVVSDGAGGWATRPSRRHVGYRRATS